MVRDAVGLVRQHPDAEGVTVTSRGDEAPRPLTGDPDLLHRAVFNLVLNAVQFAGAGGTVEVTLDASGAGDTPRGLGLLRPVRLAVRDSGPGVDPAAAGRIFDPFFTTRVGGTGLGLAVVHRAVEAHRGAVLVDRSALGGAEFVIVLPGTVSENAPASGGAAV